MLTTQCASPKTQPTFGSRAAIQRGTGDALKRWLITRSNYIDQRAVVQWAGNPVNKMMWGVGAAFTAWNTAKAKPEDRWKTLIRDGLVLTAAIGGSILAARRFKPLAQEGELLVESAKKNLGLKLEKGTLTDGAKEFKKAFANTSLRKELKAHFKDLKDTHAFKTADLEKLYDKIASVPGIGKKRVNEVFEMLFDNGEGFQEEMKEALKFFGIGGIGVLSGIAGGLVANKINGVNEPDTIPNMIKEGIFQFVANIALCAVGAGAALGLLNSDKLLSGKPAEIAGKFTGFINNSPLKKLYRTGIVMLGLCLGIFGGSHIANYVGQKYVNPLLDKLQGKSPSPERATGKRKLEMCDVMLHLDDVPTAMAIAGTAILGPWIIPFFPVSGYRAGIGYRNDGSNKNPKVATAPKPTMPPGMQNRFAYPSAYPLQGDGLQSQPSFASYYPQANAFNWGTGVSQGSFQRPQSQPIWPRQGASNQFRY